MRWNTIFTKLLRKRFEGCITCHGLCVSPTSLSRNFGHVDYTHWCGGHQHCIWQQTLPTCPLKNISQLDLVLLIRREKWDVSNLSREDTCSQVGLCRLRLLVLPGLSPCLLWVFHTERKYWRAKSGASRTVNNTSGQVLETDAPQPPGRWVWSSLFQTSKRKVRDAP